MFDFIFSWEFLWWLIMIIYVPASLGLIVVVLLQKGKGVGFAGAFGAGGGSDTVFGPRSAKSLPQKLTYTMAGLFMFLALVMSLLTDKVGRGAAPDLVEADASAMTIDALNKALDESGAAAAKPEAEAPAVEPEESTSEPAGAEAAVEETPEAQEAPEAEAPAEPPADAAPAEGADAPAETTPQP